MSVRITYDLSALTSNKRHQEHQFQATPQRLEQLLSYYALQPIRVTATATGIENQTFIVETRTRKYALRVYRQYKKTTSHIQQEVNFTRFLTAQGVAAPDVLPNRAGLDVTEATIDGNPWQFIIMHFIEGNAPRSYNPKILASMARQQARLHQLSLEYATLHPAQLTQDPRLAATWKSWLGIMVPRSWNHLDFFGSNILTQDNKVTGIIDFDDLRYSPLISCLGSTLSKLYFVTGDHQKLSFYITQYQRHRPLSRAESLQLHLLLAIRYQVLYPHRITPRGELTLAGRLARG